MLRKFNKPIIRLKALLITGSLLLYLPFFLMSSHSSIFVHPYMDQYSRQAAAWWNGRLDLAEKPDYLELVTYNGKNYNSFPPGPAVLYLIPVLLFGTEIPTLFFLLCALLIEVLVLTHIARKVFPEKWKAEVIALNFVFGSNVVYTVAQGGVCYEAQNYCFLFTTLSLLCLFRPAKKSLLRSVLGYLCLGIAISARPLHVFYLPLFIYLDGNLSKWSFVKRAAFASVLLAPIAVLMMFHNYLRFGHPLEFGHRLLPLIAKQGGYIFHPDFFLRNLYHVFLRLPSIDWSYPWLLKFFPLGSAFWLGTPIMLVGIIMAFWCEQNVRRWIIGTLFILWLPFWFHESNGWIQYNYRFIIDLLPIGFIAVLLSKKSRTLKIAHLGVLLTIAYSFNIVGAHWQNKVLSNDEVLESYRTYWIRVYQTGN